MYMCKDALDTDKEIASELEDRSEEMISKEVQRNKDLEEIWEKIRNMEDRVKDLNSCAERESTENVEINNIWLHITWKYFITNESPW